MNQSEFIEKLMNLHRLEQEMEIFGKISKLIFMDSFLILFVYFVATSYIYLVAFKMIDWRASKNPLKSLAVARFSVALGWIPTLAILLWYVTLTQRFETSSADLRIMMAIIFCTDSAFTAIIFLPLSLIQWLANAFSETARD